MRSTASFFVFSILAFFLALPANAADESTNAGDPVAEAIASVVGARDSIRGYVTDVDSAYKVTDPEYVRARDLYRTALGKYNGWSAAVAEAIAAGKEKKLRKDTAYKNIADQASNASSEFVMYVQSLRGQTKDLSVLTTLADLGLRIWNGFKDRQKKDRKERSEYFLSATKWDAWEAIATPPKDNNGKEEEDSTENGKDPTGAAR